MATKIYTARLDNMAKVITVLVNSLFLGFSSLHWALSLGFLALVTSLTAGFFYIRHYEITADSIIIHHFLRKVVIPRTALTQVEALEEGALDNSWRLFGSGGFFGYFGLFSSKTYGKMHWYVSARKQAVLVKTAEKTYILSPDNRKDFVAVLSKRR